MPLTLAGYDVAGQAKTGTGKTAAYLIAGFSHLLRKTPRPASSHPESTSHSSTIRALIIAPTRELVVQIERDARKLGAHTGLKIAAVYGGVDYEKQREFLAAGGVDMLIGTPGRLIDFVKQKVVHCHHTEFLVIDEADRMFDMGFIDDIRFVLRKLPPFTQRLSLLFSATLSHRSQELSYSHLNEPRLIIIESDTRMVDQVTQVVHHVEGSRKLSLLLGILHRELVNEGAGCRAMVFTNTKWKGEKVLRALTASGITCGYLSGDVPQANRLKVLQRFQEGKLTALVATDVAGRGLHIDGVTHVINFDLPENPEDYVHRVGRTARAGARGDAISMVDEDGAYVLEAIEKFIQMKLPVVWPGDELFVPVKRLSVPLEDGERIVPSRPDSSRPARGATRGGAASHTAAAARNRRKPATPPPGAAAPPAAGAPAPPPAGGAPPATGARPTTETENTETAPAATPARRRRRRRRPPSASGAPEQGSAPASSNE